MLLTNLNIATLQAGYGLLENAALEIAGEHITWVGPAAVRPDGPAIDCGGKLLTPGLIDCHTHLVYGGNRAQEFEQRLQGVSYADIAKAGGGIKATVRATRAATEQELLHSASHRLQSLLQEGVTTVEIKSGYGLDVATELKMLRVARQLGNIHPVTVKTTFLGAHAVPEEFEESRQDYINLVCNQMLDKITSQGLADAVDSFCEAIAFSHEETEQVFQAAKHRGLPVKLHADQLTNMKGAALAARYGALSVDHIEYTDEESVKALAASGTVAVLLPGAFYYLREKQQPPVAALRHAGVPMAVATDMNPGSSPIQSLLTIMNMACVLFGLTPEEALQGTTTHAARALRLEDRGVIAVGKRADLALWQVAHPGELSYAIGANPLATVIQNGQLVRGTLQEQPA